MVPNQIPVAWTAYGRVGLLWLITRSLCFGTGYYVFGQYTVGKKFEKRKLSTLEALKEVDGVDMLLVNVLDATERKLKAAERILKAAE